MADNENEPKKRAFRTFHSLNLHEKMLFNDYVSGNTQLIHVHMQTGISKASLGSWKKKVLSGEQVKPPGGRRPKPSRVVNPPAPVPQSIEDTNGPPTDVELNLAEVAKHLLEAFEEQSTSEAHKESRKNWISEHLNKSQSEIRNRSTGSRNACSGDGPPVSPGSCVLCKLLCQRKYTASMSPACEETGELDWSDNSAGASGAPVETTSNPSNSNTTQPPLMHDAQLSVANRPELDSGCWNIDTIGNRKLSKTSLVLSGPAGHYQYHQYFTRREHQNDGVFDMVQYYRCVSCYNLRANRNFHGKAKQLQDTYYMSTMKKENGCYKMVEQNHDPECRPSSNLQSLVTKIKQETKRLVTDLNNAVETKAFLEAAINLERFQK